MSTKILSKATSLLLGVWQLGCLVFLFIAFQEADTPAFVGIILFFIGVQGIFLFRVKLNPTLVRSLKVINLILMIAAIALVFVGEPTTWGIGGIALIGWTLLVLTLTNHLGLKSAGH